MIKWLRDHHWLHSWGKWYPVGNGYWYQRQTCEVCGFSKDKQL